MPKGYDQSNIGKCISRWSDKMVYLYGENQVIKFSRVVRFFGKKAQDRYELDYAICRKYFKKFVLETETRLCERNNFVSIQDFIDGIPLNLSHLNDPAIKK